jgi:hypothetical protein
MLKHLMAMAVVMSVAPTSLWAESATWMKVADAVASTVGQAEECFLRGKGVEAKRLATEAYFLHFESGELEAAIRTGRGSRRVQEVEKKFARLRTAIGSGDRAAVGTLVAEIQADVRTEAAALDAVGYRLPPPPVTE